MYRIVTVQNLTLNFLAISILKENNDFYRIYIVIGTLSHAKIILELLLQKIKPKLFLRGEIPPQPPSSQGRYPLTPP